MDLALRFRVMFAFIVTEPTETSLAFLVGIILGQRTKKETTDDGLPRSITVCVFNRGPVHPWEHHFKAM